jgi:hypothetical protein
VQNNCDWLLRKREVYIIKLPNDNHIHMDGKHGMWWVSASADAPSRKQDLLFCE